ncbi:hypothetical protein N7520_005040 [Penicillium odoratum]|uniref:uncharacterized protein n=1 Tax=Penicillium odoratum TaxID=1167516 RepID=UPI002547110F|nr:uncharacterized protein N7520_005040 [Penicillium odoratum]KAJ5765481.1 hypothetical protein N7520_005040 [Penicillium odoratum]
MVDMVTDGNPEPEFDVSIQSPSPSIESQEYTSEDEVLEISEQPNENNGELDRRKSTPARGPVLNPPTPRRQVQEGSIDGAILPSIVQTMNQGSVGKSSETLRKSLERDSGYASTSRPAMLALSSEITFRPNIGPPVPGTLNETRSGYYHEPQSLASDNEDISSQVSGDTDNEEKMASQALIRVFLAEEPLFRDLCQNAIVQMSRERFVENLQRLLKSFHKNLSAEAETEAEKAVARILRSRQGRQRISQQLAVHILEEQGEGLKSDRTISEMKIFMRKARSFQVLLKDFMIMFLPSDLQCVLLSIPKNNIWVSQEQDLSLINRAKGWIEDQTQARWNWWPLKPRKRLLRDSESRMFWQCVNAKL